MGIETCNKDISKIIIAGSFRHDYLVIFFHFKLPFANLGIENLW